MSTVARVQWGKRARWSFRVGAVFAVLGACSSSTIDEPASDQGGKGGGGSGAAGDSHLPTAGMPSARPHAGEGGGLPNGGSAGNAGCSLEDMCGGCEARYYVIACSWGELEYRQNDDWQASCLGAQAQEGAGGAAGAAGASADAPGAAGASSYPGTCHTYRPRGDVVVGCDDGCTETFHEDKVGECVLRDECCIVLSRMACAL